MRNLLQTTVLTCLLSIANQATTAPEVHYDECLPQFTYKDVNYLGTTNKDNNSSQWCYLKTPREGSTWGNVRPASIPLRKTVTGRNCLAASTYEGEVFYGCASKNHHTFWCYVDSAKNWEDCDTGDLVTLPAHTQPQASQIVERVVLGSCFKPQSTAQQAMQRVIDSQPDLFLWLGDNIYADTSNMSVMRNKYDEKKQNVIYQQFLTAKIPVIATWDDHDFGANNEGRYYPKRVESQLEFLRHFDIPDSDIRYAGQQGVYSAIMQGQTGKKIHTIMLDARFHRSPTFSSYGPCEGDNSTILGTQQWEWLAQELAKPSDIKIIGSGIQVLPALHRSRALTNYCAYGNGQHFNAAIASMDETNMSGTEYESWAEIPQEREKLLRMVQKSINEGKTKLVIFASGDQHWGELLGKTIPASAQHGAAARVYEVTASGFGQNWPHDVPHANRLPVWADEKGNGDFKNACVFPFKYKNASYDHCTTVDHSRPWCYTKLDANGVGVAGQWGNCARTGDAIPTGFSGTVPVQLSDISTADRHLVNKSGSNYGQIDIDWEKRQVTLSIQMENIEAVSTIVSF